MLASMNIGIPLWAQRNTAWIEQHYARGIYPKIQAVLSFAYDWCPFSLAEVVLLLAACSVLFLVAKWLWALRSILEDDILVWFGRGIWTGAMIAATIQLAFLLSWGLNYYRLPLADQWGWEMTAASSEELVALAMDLGTQANVLRELLPEDAEGVVLFAKPLEDYVHVVWQKEDGGLSQKSAKPVLVSPLMSYTMITGFYFPFTGEANVNTHVPIFELPATVAHEIAHRTGIAREDEANFVSWQQSQFPHADTDVRYSGTLRALVYTLNAAARGVSSEDYAAIWKNISPAVDRDLVASRTFWDRYRGPIQQASEQVNDSFLRSNQQTDGVQSYGRMVDLLLAEKRQAS